MIERVYRRIRSVIRASLDGLETVEDINNGDHSITLYPVSVPGFIYHAQYIYIHIYPSIITREKVICRALLFTLYFQF